MCLSYSPVSDLRSKNGNPVENNWIYDIYNYILKSVLDNIEYMHRVQMTKMFTVQALLVHIRYKRKDCNIYVYCIVNTDPNIFWRIHHVILPVQFDIDL